MEQFSLSTKESGVNRVIGFNPDTEEEILNYFKKKFETNSAVTKEKEKVPEQVETIARLNEEIKDFLAKYGITAISIPLDNIHFLDREKITPDELEAIQKRFGTKQGFFSSTKQSLAIIRDYQAGKLPFFQTVVHEMLHLQGFYSFQRSRGKNDLTLKDNKRSVDLNIRRSGFSIGTTDGKTLFFNEINEAIITELAIRFEKTYMLDYSELVAEIKKRDEFIRQIAEEKNVSAEEIKKSIAYVNGDNVSDCKFIAYSYYDERKRFDDLIDELYIRNMDDFKDREQVFALFAKATMTGRILPIARLIEKTFGKGFFRRIGERSANRIN